MIRIIIRIMRTPPIVAPTMTACGTGFVSLEFPPEFEPALVGKAEEAVPEVENAGVEVCTGELEVGSKPETGGTVGDTGDVEDVFTVAEGDLVAEVPGLGLGMVPVPPGKVEEN
jgi:hypothetical protein